MASHRIHHDQENRNPGLRQKPTSNNSMAAHQKRPALGVIDKNKPVLKEGKQMLIGKKNLNENKKNLVAPVVPVAQFEAFKVYEDDEYMARIDQKLRLISKSNVYKGTAEDKFITKAELAEIERKKLEEKLKEPNIDVPKIELKCDMKSPATPMSVEKSLDDSQLAKEVILKNNRNGKDIFFEMDEYRDDIYIYLREHELRHRPKSGYIQKQPDVTENMRSILVDWLVEVTEEYRLQTETLYLAINFIDRFLSYMSVVRAKLQLVGTAAMFIAAKYEEILPPDVSEFVYITDDTYDKHQVIRMEHLILRVLGFDLSIPTPLTFINAMCISAKLTEKTMYLAMYLSELALLKVEPYLEFLPSVIAAGSIALARHTLGEEVWNEEMRTITGYTLKELEDVINFLYDLFIIAATLPQRAIQDKYKSTKYLEVSKIIPKNEIINFG